jgi:Ni/Co efflux regulator RcnB
VKTQTLANFGLVAILVLAGSAARAQDRGQGGQSQARNGNGQNLQFDDNARQTTNNWYNQHKNNPPAGLRTQDQLSADQESRLRPGALLDQDLRNKVHTAPRDLTRRLPPPPSGDRYVTIGGHVGSINNRYQVHDVIHLHDNR